MKTRYLTSVLIQLVCLALFAQGTADDYKRAFGHREKFNSRNVYHSPENIAFLDSGSTFTYRINTPEGERFIAYNAESNERHTFNSSDELNSYLGIKPTTSEKPRFRFGRHKERHWMEVDEERDSRPVPSPVGKWEAYIESDNVVLHEKGKPYTEAKKLLSSDGTLSNYYSANILWSPDSKYILTSKRRPVEKRYVYYVESSPADQLQPILHKQEYAKPGDELPYRVPVIFNIVSGKRTEADMTLMSRQYDLTSFAWTTDSHEVTMEYNERGHKTYRVLAMNAETGSVRTVIEETSDTFVNYSRHFRHDTSDGRHIIWMSERDNWNHLYMYDFASGKVANQITQGDWCVRRVIKIDEPNKTIYFTASGVNKKEDPYLIHYYRINFDGSNMKCLTPAEGNHTATFSHDYRFLVDVYSKTDTPPVAELRSADDGKLIATLEKADISKLKEMNYRAPEVFKAKGRDGRTDIWGIIVRPTNFDPARKYPVIEYIYAGPGEAYTPKSFSPSLWNMSDLAELGFIVVQLDGMGTSWRGKKFEDVCYKNLKDAGFPDRIEWIKAAAKKYPYIDAERVGIFGASAGGQESTAAVLFHNDFYKAAYSSCGCHDNRMDKIWWNEQWMSYPVDSSYVASSNTANAHLLNRPLMLVVGELDDNVDPASTYQLANALIKANKNFELVVLPGVRHTMGEKYGEHKRYDFFVKNLLGIEPPEW